MNNDGNVMTKLEPRCVCCLCEKKEKFSTENMTRIVQDLMNAEVNLINISYEFLLKIIVFQLPPLFKYVPSVFCVDCVAYLEEYKKFKATVELSFVTLEKLVLEKGLNKLECLEMLKLTPRVSPDPNAAAVKEVKLVRRLWKCAGRPRKDGTPAQPRFFKVKRKTPPVYDSDSYKSKSSDDENYCRRSDNEEWNPDKKIVSLQKREKKYKTKHNSVSKGSGKRGRPKKSLDNKAEVLKECRVELKIKPHNGIITKSDQFNGNHDFGVKKKRGRPPKTSETLNDQKITPFVKKKVLQKSYFNDSNISSNDERDLCVVSKKGRGRPKKEAVATKLDVKKKEKKRKRAMVKPIIKSIVKKKRGRPPKNPLTMDDADKKTVENKSSRKRKRNQMEKSNEWVTDTEDERKIKEEVFDSDSDATTEDSDVIPKHFKGLILAS